MVRFLFGLLIIGVLARPAAAAGAALPGPYAADVVRVLDGDSFEARIRIWLDQDVTVTVRLAGVDAAERDAPCAGAQIMARLATAALTARLSGGVTLSDVERDKYGGRVVARVRDAGGADVSDTLAAAGLVRPYAGRRPVWCP